MTRRVRGALVVAGLALLLLLTAMAVSLHRASTIAQEMVSKQERAFAAQRDSTNQ